MRWVVLVLALGGGGGSGYAGWVARESAVGLGELRQYVHYGEETKLRNASYFLMAGAAMGLIGALLALARRGILAALVLLAAWAGPAAFIWEMVLRENTLLIRWGICTGALLLAALLAMLIRPKKVIPEDERAYAGV